MKDYMLRVRMTDVECEQLAVLADRLLIGSSEWVRKAIRVAYAESVRGPTGTKRSLAELVDPPAKAKR